MSDTPFNDPFAAQHQAPPRPMADPPKSAQAPDRKSSADMTKGKTKRNMTIWFVLPPVIGVMIFIMWPHKRSAATVAKVDSQQVDNTNQNGQTIVQAAKEAEGASEAQRSRAAQAAAAAGAAAGSHDPNAYAANAIGQTNYAAGTTSYAANGTTPANATPGDPNAARAAAAARSADEQQRQRAEAEKLAQKQAEIAAAEIQANNVTTMQQPGSSSTSNVTETPQQHGARLMQELQDGQAQQNDALTKAIQLATAGGRDGTPGLVTSHSGQQDQWLSAQASEGGKVTQVQAKANGYIIDEGTPIRTVLITGLNTDAPGVVTAQITSDVYDSASGDTLLIPRGTKVLGSYNHNINNGQTRVLVALTRMIRPDGSWIDLSSASGAEMDGEGGLEGDVNNHFLKIFGSALVVGAATLLMDKSQQQTTVSQGLGTTQMGGSIFAQTLQQVVDQLLSRNKDIPPTITRDAGTEFIFMVRRDMSLTPYYRSSGVRS